jgi:spore germination protein GerM
MEERKSRSKSVVATISALTLASIVVGGGLAWFTIQNNRTQTNIPSKINSPNPIAVDPAQVTPQQATTIPVAPNSTTVVPIPSTKPTTAGEQTTKSTTPSFAQKQENTVKIWRLDDDGKKTVLVPQERKDTEASTTNPETRINRSMSSLIASAGKPDGKLTSTIPVGTKLLSATVKSDGIHVDLSKEFTQGYGATSMIGRLGQVVYTATADNPTAPVWITVEGKKLEVLGDVGVEIRQPITRQTYDQDFPINPSPSTTPENKS